MGCGYSKREVELLEQLRQAHYEAEANRRTIQSWQEHVHRHMQDAQAYRRTMAAKLTDSQNLLNASKVEAHAILTAAQNELDKVKNMVADIQQTYANVPRPPVELLNIHGTLIERKLIASVEIQRYRGPFSYQMGRVYLHLTDGSKREVMDDRDEAAMRLVQYIHKMLKNQPQSFSMLRGASENTMNPPVY